MNTHCKRCETAFKAPLADWQAVATCDRCAGELLAYFTTSTTPRQAVNRIKAAKRLYAKVEAPKPWDPNELVELCEVDFTPQPAPAYDDVAPTHIDPMYEAVAAGEREAAARFRADRNALGFDG